VTNPAGRISEPGAAEEALERRARVDDWLAGWSWSVITTAGRSPESACSRTRSARSDLVALDLVREQARDDLERAQRRRLDAHAFARDEGDRSDRGLAVQERDRDDRVVDHPVHVRMGDRPRARRVVHHDRHAAGDRLAARRLREWQVHRCVQAGSLIGGDPLRHRRADAPAVGVALPRARSRPWGTRAAQEARQLAVDLGDRGRLDQQARHLADRLALELGAPLLGHVDHHADQARRPSVRGRPDAHVVADPDGAAVRRAHAVLERVVLAAHRRLEARLARRLALVGVDLVPEEVGVGEPAVGREAEQRLGVCADVEETPGRDVDLPDDDGDLVDR
jgi:hypothetical protein